jgi:hypothetical protein
MEDQQQKQVAAQGRAKAKRAKLLELIDPVIV